MANFERSSDGAVNYAGFAILPRRNQSGSVITSTHAVLFREIPGVSNSLDYAKAVSALVSPNQIHSVICDKGMVKIFFKEVRYAERVVIAGIDVRGSHITPCYADHSVMNVTLQNVDSAIPDNVLEKALQDYGKLVSKIVPSRFPEDDLEYSHIQTGDKQVYMSLHSGLTVPDVIPVKHDNRTYEILTRARRYVYRPQSAGSSKSTTPPVVDLTRRRSINQKASRIIKNYKNRNALLKDFARKHSSNSVPKKNIQNKSPLKKNTNYSQSSLSYPSVSTNIDSTYSTNDRSIKLLSTISVTNADTVADDSSDDNSDSPVGIIEKTIEAEKERAQFASRYPYPLTLEQLEMYLYQVKNVNSQNVQKMTLDFLVGINVHGLSLQVLSEQLNSLSRCCSKPGVKKRITRLVDIFNNDY